MVKWKKGDKFIVTKTVSGLWLKKGDIGEIYDEEPVDRREYGGNINIYFAPTKSIAINRIKKLNPNIEIW